MYAVFKSGGKQHRVQEGDTVKLEKLEVETGSTVDFDEVLVVGEGEAISIGAPFVDGSVVSAEVVSHGRAAKINILKFRRRKHHMKRAGHRQWFTEVKITSIAASGAKAAKKAAPAAKAAPAPAKTETAPKAADAPNAAAGDLSVLKGVGPAMVEKLTGAGVASLESMAGLSDDDKARVGEELNVAAKLDAWIEQAKELVSGEG